VRPVPGAATEPAAGFPSAAGLESLEIAVVDAARTAMAIPPETANKRGLERGDFDVSSKRFTGDLHGCKGKEDTITDRAPD